MSCVRFGSRRMARAGDVPGPPYDRDNRTLSRPESVVGRNSRARSEGIGRKHTISIANSKTFVLPII